MICVPIEGKRLNLKTVELSFDLSLEKWRRHFICAVF